MDFEWEYGYLLRSWKEQKIYPNSQTTCQLQNTKMNNVNTLQNTSYKTKDDWNMV